MTELLLTGYFALVFVATAAAGYLVVSRRRAVTDQGETSVLLEPAPERESALNAAPDPLTGMLQKLGERGPATPSGGIRKMLVSAGYRDEAAPAVYQGIKTLVAGTLALILASFAWFNQQDGSAAVIAACAGAGFGMMFPDKILRRVVRARSDRIRSAIPACLDMIVLSVEAGQSLNQAILDASAELRDAYPDLSNELAQVHLELRAGKGRAEALYHLGERNREPELRKMANVMIDADRFGTSLAPALRTHARFLRTRMRQQAQEAARKVSVKLVFPVFFLIFPSVLLVTLGPAVLKMMEQFSKIIGE
jgi:tight adherence protein C